MSQITDKKISKVYSGKEIEGRGQFYNFYLEGGKKKFGLFVGKGKTIPKEGMRVALLEWETTQDGEYENNKVKNIVWMGADTETQGAKPSESRMADKNSPIWFCLSYVKDMQVARIQAGIAGGELEDISLDVARIAIDMLRFIEHPVKMGLEEPKQDPPDKIQQAHDVLDEEIPF